MGTHRRTLPPGHPRNKLDLLVEARAALGMSIPPEWGSETATLISNRDTTSGTASGSAVATIAIAVCIVLTIVVMVGKVSMAPIVTAPGVHYSALIAAASGVNTIEIFTLISVLATTIFMGAHCFIQIGCWRGVLLLCREVGTQASLAIARLIRAIRRVPALLQIIAGGLGTGAVVAVMFMLVRGTNGFVTEAGMPRTSTLTVNAPVPSPPAII